MADSIPLSAAAERLGCHKRTLTRATTAGCPDYEPAPGSREKRIDVREYQAWRDARDQQRRDLRRQVADAVRAGGAVPPQPASAPVTVPVSAPAAPAPRAVAPAPTPAAPTPGPTAADPDVDVVVASADDDGDVAPPAAAGAAPRAAVRPKKLRPSVGPDAAGAETAVEPSLPPDLLLALQRDKVLRITRSLCVRRVLRTSMDVVPGTDALTGITLEEWREAIESGGPEPLLLRKFGPGAYMVSWIGPAGGELFRQTYDIPDLDDEVRALQHQQREADREAAERKRETKQADLDQRRAEAEQRRVEARDQAQRDGEAALLDAQRRSAHDWANTAVRETARRVRWAAAEITGLLTGVASEYARRTAELGRSGQFAAQQAARLEAAKADAAAQAEGRLESLRTAAAPTLAPRDLEPLGDAHLARLLDELERVRSFDLRKLHHDVLDALWQRRDFLPAPPLIWTPTGPALHTGLIATVERFLPQVPSAAFQPWVARELVGAPAWNPPPPLPRPVSAPPVPPLVRRPVAPPRSTSRPGLRPTPTSTRPAVGPVR